MEREQFTIILVDDHHDDMDEEKAKISEYVEGQGFSTNLLLSKRGVEVVGYLKDHNVDVILTDKNLGGRKGLDIIKEVRKNHSLTDILYYSGAGMNTNEKKAVKNFFVEVIGGRDIVAPATRMINKSIQKWENIIFLRGILISKIIELEQDVDFIFERYFKIRKKMLKHFREFVLYNSHFAFEGKKKALSLMIDSDSTLAKFKPVVGKLGALQEQRNNLAHCKSSPDIPNCLLKMDGTVKYTKSEMSKLLKTSREAKYILDEMLSELS